MKEEIKKVRTKVGGETKVVSEISVPIYESVEELINSESEERIVSVFNKGNHIRIMGNERIKFSEGKKSVKALRNAAFNLLTTEELMSVAQDAAKLEALLDSAVIQKRVQDQLSNVETTDNETTDNETTDEYGEDE